MSFTRNLFAGLTGFIGLGMILVMYRISISSNLCAYVVDKRIEDATSSSSDNSGPCHSPHGTSQMTICPGDVIPEHIALSFESCTDERSVADPSKTTLISTYERSTYKQGDMVLVTITLFDGYGKRKTVGGDHLRTRLVGDGGRNIVTGMIYDHDNGSYSALFEAIFPGELTVEAVLEYPRELITGLYRIRTLIAGTRNINAEYVNKNEKEEAACHTMRERLTQYKDVCNFTLDNSGMPWYCGAPTNRNIICQDYLNNRMQTPYPVLPLNDVETRLAKRKRVVMAANLKITVTPCSPNAISTRSALLPCSVYNRTELWTKREPTGFFYQGDWFLRHCHGKPFAEVQKCLRNSRVILFGDSTTRQWYQDIMKRFNCTIVTEVWSVAKWTKPSRCVNKDLQLTVEWTPHAQPFFGSYDNARTSSWSIDRHIDDDIGDNERVVVLLHMYMHVLAYRHEVFQIKMRRIRQSVDRLFARNKLAYVLIKGPHTFKDTPAGPVRLNDYFGYLYRNILFREFSGLYDRVVYLDHKDITNALQLTPNHPPAHVVSAMVDQMFSYVC